MLGGVLGLVGLSAIAGVLVTATVTPAIAVSGYAASSAITLFENMPSYLEVDQPMLPTRIYADDPNSDQPYELASFYDQNRLPVEWDGIGQVMYDALLSSEDPKYFEHGGVDIVGTAKALASNALNDTSRGGSTITQQYVKNVLVQECEKDAADDEERVACYQDATESDGTAGIERKLQEMRYAIALEKKYSKEEILLGYLNIANFGGVTYGIEAAAQYYFGTTAKDLTLVQAATLAGMVQNPNFYRIDMPNGTAQLKDGTWVNSAADGYAKTMDRRNYVLQRMFQDGKITEEENVAAHAEPVVPAVHPRQQGCISAGGSAYFCQYVKSIILNDPASGATPEDRQAALRRGGLNIYTSIDLRVQAAAENAIHTRIPAAIDGMELGSTGVTLEVGTGRVLAMAQNTNFSEDPAVIATQRGYSSLVFAADYAHGGSTGFGVGSTFKVFTLLDWLEKGHSTNEVLNGVNRNAFTGFNCDGAPIPQTSKVGNFANNPGYTGTIKSFTRDSLNSGYFAMASKLNLCDIMRVADRLHLQTMQIGDRADGVTHGTMLSLDPKKTPNIGRNPVPFDLLGSLNFAPMNMASVYATIANKGLQCLPRAIDLVTDSTGKELPKPESQCEQNIQPEIAATAADALAGVMNGGTGRDANNYDGVPVIGKTGTHEKFHTSMMQASTKTATFVWVGNVSGERDLFTTYVDSGVLSSQRYAISKEIQGAANSYYGGDAFPPPDPNLTRTVLVDLPSVIGKSIDEAKNILYAAGFNPVVGEPVPGVQPEGVIELQDPGAGKVAGGTTVTISPSNGQGRTVPDVSGQTLDAAMSAVASAGFNAQPGACTESPDGGAGRVTGTTPGANTVLPEGSTVTVEYASADCGGPGGPGGDGGGPGKGHGPGDDGDG